MTATAAPAANPLADKVLLTRFPEESIRLLVRGIGQDLLSHSRYLREVDFRTIHTSDLEFLFGAYDDRFFDGMCRRALDKRRLSFRLSSRMTQASGKTTRFRSRSGEISYEISVASAMLFDGFGKTDRRVSVCGIDCANRLEALQRTFEHEMVHLAEMFCWVKTDCSAGRFQILRGDFFCIARIRTI